MKSKVFLRLALRRLRVTHPEQAANITEVLRDPDLLEALLVESQSEAEKELGSFGDGPFMGFLNWLIEHPELVIKLITTILVLVADREEV